MYAGVSGTMRQQMATSDGPNGVGTRAPHEFPGRILLAVLGLNPRVLTDTLYALASPDDRGAPRFVPTEVRIVTTTAGRDVARRELLDPETGRFFRFCADHRLDPRSIAFGDESFIVAQRDGRPLEDVVATADHAAVAATLVRLVRRLTADDGTALYASLAGGRRTMAFYLGHALSLYGRPQDRLTHALVHSPSTAADRSRYAPPTRASAPTSGPPRNASTAPVTLVDVPFLRLRRHLPPAVIDGLPPPGAVDTAATGAAPPAPIEIHFRRRLLAAGPETVHLPPADLAFYAVMARRRAERRDFVNHRTPDLVTEYLREYAAATADQWAVHVDRVRRRLRNGVDRLWFEQRKARVNRAIRIALGPWLGRPYQIVSRGRRPDTRFGLSIDPAAIVFRE